jgi:heavy metal sensor kinase
MSSGRTATRSLRTTLLIGIAVIVIPLVAAFAIAVYGRARGAARQALLERLLVRAEAIASLVEIEGDEVELELPMAVMPEYDEPASGAYFIVYDWEGDAFMTSPSLGEASLPSPPPWKEEDHSWVEIEDGPGGTRCAVLTFSFKVRLDGYDDDDAYQNLPEAIREQLRYQVQIALDCGARDESLASLAAFLWISGGITVALALLAGAFLARRLMKPIHAMTETARSLTPGDTDRRLEPGSVVTELDSLATTLNSAFDRLGAALEHQKRFTADASHELRTPAAILLSNAELLLRLPRTAEEYRAGLERQVVTARRMAALIGDLLTLARADAGRHELVLGKMDLADVATAVCREHEPLAEENGIDLCCATESGVHIEGDRRQLAQLATNLLANALKFVRRGGHVAVRVAREGPHAVLSVTDDGPGIPEEHHRRLFDRFHRLDPDEEGETTGTGLGLAIASWIVGAHDGEIDVKSSPGEGATFRVRIPSLR